MTPALISIQYVGKRPAYTDGAYGTGIRWVQGESKLVPADKAVLLLKHKDVYAPGEDDAPVADLIIKPKTDEQDDKQDMRDTIASMDKAAVAAFAKMHFNVDLPKNKGLPALREQVTGLFDQYGIN